MSTTSKAMRQSFALRFSSNAFLVFWCVIAAFPILWIAVMSVKSPVDAFAQNPMDVIMGPNTLARGDGLSILDIILGLAVLYFAIRWMFTRLPALVARYSPSGWIVLGWLIGAAVYALAFLLVFFGLLPLILAPLNAVLGPLGDPVLGLTTQHYIAVWGENEFYRNFLNSMLVTAGVVTISLTVGTLAGYGLARSGSDLAFWLLILALIFRALPHSVDRKSVV